MVTVRVFGIAVSARAFGDKLTTAAHECGERDLYVGDDGKIHGF